MKIFCAGGVSEHGRTCFLVETDHQSFLLDCGIKKGATTDYPLLEDQQIAKLSHAFISHSHADHAGALPWLLEHGFTGCAVMSASTRDQISFVGYGMFLPSLPGSLSLGPDFFVEWGRSGHCEGSLWFRFTLEGLILLYSGDYCETSLAYTCDALRLQEADLAILDCAYGKKSIKLETSTAKLRALVEKNAQKGYSTLFPVPQFGRGNDLKILFKDEPSVAFFQDPQLRKPLPKELLGSRIIFTGTLEKGTRAYGMIKKHQAKLVYYPVHMNFEEVKLLAARNMFRQIIIFHGERSAFGRTIPPRFLLPRPGDSLPVLP
ncbi:MBL fold metallo-hydrolase [uncultured Sphaerochaeta sp.]|uniref:MBL fold metallo-hydrolase n=1 Tax=uncultured Sphaerochaeta sp. TaxID=886478 RepID=UPI002A0A4F3D|nr:MBL fold metallo-hydrolase [uncultured Sphaerochaeta sp.]